jgi:hypothetical protein
MQAGGAIRGDAKRGISTRPGNIFAFALVVLFAVSADAQEASNVGALSGTLKKVKETGSITLGYRESSLPFSYLNRRDSNLSDKPFAAARRSLAGPVQPMGAVGAGEISGDAGEQVEDNRSFFVE